MDASTSLSRAGLPRMKLKPLVHAVLAALMVVSPMAPAQTGKPPLPANNATNNPSNVPVTTMAPPPASAATTAAVATPAAGMPVSAGIAPAAGDKVSLNFVAADIDAVAGAIGQMSNRTFILDPRVRGQITLATPEPVARDEAYRMLLAVLRMQGFAVIEDGRFAKVVPEPDAKLHGGRVDAKEQASVRGDQIITQVFRMNYESAASMVPVLRPLISPNNTITAHESNNSLVITDYAENLKRIGRIISTMDVPGAVELEVIALKHAVAIDLATMVTRLLDDGRGAGAGAAPRVTVLADSRTNSLLLRSNSRLRAEQARSLIERLDQPGERNGNIHIVYLRNAEATKLAQLLRSILTGDAGQASTTSSNTSGFSSGLGNNGTSSSSTSSTTSATNGNQMAATATGLNAGGSLSGGTSTSSTAPAAQAVSGGIIQADPSTNSLIITAPEPVYRNLRDIIEKLDVRRAQVFIETLIVEVSSDTAAEFGVQWLNLSGLDGSGTSVIGGQIFSNAGTSIVAAAQDLTSISSGLNIGVVRGKITLPGIGEVTNLGFLARALESRGNANILSTPNIMTLDNEEASAVVGQNVPFVTGSYTNTTSSTTSSSVNPFQTIERKDVGITLKVKPQVSEGGAVKMRIYQEVSNVLDKSMAAGIITNKRSLDTNVVVDDGQIIVLGGLVEDRSTNGADKVPLLGDIPVLGTLFRSEKRTRNKTNLMVFLRPYVIRDSASASAVVADRYEFMRARGQESETTKHWALPDVTLPTLPELDKNATVKPPAPLIRPEPVGTPATPIDAARDGKSGS